MSILWYKFAFHFYVALSIEFLINKRLIIFFFFTYLGRPTEIPEKDVYLCESLYDETKPCTRELPRDGLKKYVHSAAVTQDEIYFFRRLINPPKVIFFF